MRHRHGESVKEEIAKLVSLLAEEELREQTGDPLVQLGPGDLVERADELQQLARRQILVESRRVGQIADAPLDLQRLRVVLGRETVGRVAAGAIAIDVRGTLLNRRKANGGSSQDTAQGIAR